MKNLHFLLFFLVLLLASCKKEPVDADTQNFIIVQSQKYLIGFSQVLKPGTSNVSSKATIELRSVSLEKKKNIKLIGHSKNSTDSFPASFDMILDSLVIDSLQDNRVITQTYFYKKPIALSYSGLLVRTNKDFEVTANDSSKRKIEFTFYLPRR